MDFCKNRNNGPARGDGSLQHRGRARQLCRGCPATRPVAGRGHPSGELAVTAPTQFGRLHLAPVLPAFLERHADLASTALVAVRLGEVRRVVVGAPAYLAAAGVPASPEALARHRLIAPTSLMTAASWGFVVDGRPVAVRVQARLAASQPDVAIDAARAGFGLTRVPLYQVADDVGADRLRIVLDHFEEPPLPVHLITIDGRRAAAKVRAFVDFTVPRLRAALRGPPEPSRAG